VTPRSRSGSRPLLALGRHHEAIPQLQSAVDAQPLHERLWALLALALYRGSRQADALRAVARARDVLLDELGLDPGPELRDLEQRILAHDASLLLDAAPARPVPSHTPAVVHVPRVSLVGRPHEWRSLVDALEAAQGGTRPRAHRGRARHRQEHPSPRPSSPTPEPRGGGR
jgi:DNA-binding SARP family transcriptional activator